MAAGGRAVLKLWFVGSDHPELHRTHFSHEILTEPLQAVRGNDAGAYPDSASFKWTSSVKALSIFMLRVAEASLMGTGSAGTPALTGERRSAAASLDYALSRDSNWLVEMFGADARGDSLARRFIKRSNPELKRKGPVALSLNENVLSSRNIEIFFDDKPITDPKLLREIADRIKEHWSLPEEGETSPAPIPLTYQQPPEDREGFIGWISSQIKWWDSRFVLPKIPAVSNLLTELYVEPEFVVDQGTPLSTDKLLHQFFQDQENRGLLLTGKMGTGKSFFLRFLTLEFQQFQTRLKLEKNYVPILISLGRFEALQGSLTRSLVEYYMGHGYEGSASTLQRFLQASIDSGQALLMFDGLDEIVDYSRRAETLAIIRQHFEGPVRSNGNKLIISGHDEAFAARDLRYEGFRTTQIGRWRPYQVFVGCQRWSWEHGDDGEQFWKLLQANDTLFSLARWPLIFHLLTTLYSTSGLRAFQDLAGICDACCEVLEDSWSYARRTFRKRSSSSEESDRHSPESFGWLRWRHFLILLMEESLKRLEEDGKPLPLSFSSSEIISTWDTFLKKRGVERESLDFSRLEDLIQYQNTIGPVFYHRKVLVESDEEQVTEEYSFLDDTFGHYYLAKAIINQPTTLQERAIAHLRDPRWSNVLPLAIQELGRSERTYENELADSLLTTIQNIDDDFALDRVHGIGHFRVFTGMRALGSINLDTYWSEVVEPWISIYFNSDYAYDVATAFEILGEYSASPRIRSHLFEHFNQMMDERESGTAPTLEKWRVFAAMAKIGEKADQIVDEFVHDIDEVVTSTQLASAEQSIALRRFIWCLRQVGRLFKRDLSSTQFRPNFENIDRIRTASMKLVEFIASNLEKELKAEQFSNLHMWDAMTALVQTQHRLHYHQNLSSTLLRFATIVLDHPSAFAAYPGRMQCLIFLRAGLRHGFILPDSEITVLKEKFQKLKDFLHSDSEIVEIEMILILLENRREIVDQETDARELHTTCFGPCTAERIAEWVAEVEQNEAEVQEDHLKLGSALGGLSLYHQELAGPDNEELRTKLIQSLLRALQLELDLEYNLRERERYYSIPFTDHGYPIYDQIQSLLVQLGSLLPLTVGNSEETQLRKAVGS